MQQPPKHACSPGGEQPGLVVSADADELEAGRAYRLEVTRSPDGNSGEPPVAQVRIDWDHAGEGGDEYFPFPRDRAGWLAPVREASGSRFVEFRAPPHGKICFHLESGSDTRIQASDHSLRIEPLGPSIPTEMLRRIPDIASKAQDRCQLLDVRRWTGDLVPLRGKVSAQDTNPAGRQRIAFIGSRELREELSFDATIVPLEESNWKELLGSSAFDYLLLEPVLHVDHVSWRHVMARSGDRRQMRELLRHCSRARIPVVLWLRIEPEIYGEFSWLVPHADRVYAIDKVIQRMAAAGHPGANPQLLPPCVQPRLHSPVVNPGTEGLAEALSRNVLLDGWWQLAGGERTAIMDELHRDRLLVAESEWELSFTRLNTLPPFRWNMLGCLDQDEKALLCRLVGAELFLPGDSVPGWRREQMMLRAAACGSIVLFRDEGLKSVLIDEGLCLHGDDEGLLRALPTLLDDALARARWRHRTVRSILQNHTYKARLAHIARDLDIQRQAAPPKVACLLVSMRPWLLEECIQRFHRDLYPEKELVIIVHGSPATAREMAIRAGDDDRIQVHQLGKARSLGACLNYAAMQTDAPFWAKVDDDDLYGPGYLSDMMLYQEIAGSSLLAKPPEFLYFEEQDELRWHGQRARNAWMHHATAEGEATAGIAGGTLLGKRELLQEVPFSELRRGGSDSDFALRARAAGHDLMVTDPFNFAFFRSDRPGFHTWNLDSGRLKRRSVKVGNAASLDTVVFI